MFTRLRKCEADKRTAKNKMNLADKIRTEQIRSEKKVAVRQEDRKGATSSLKQDAAEHVQQCERD